MATITITLKDTAAWDEFVAHNREAIEEEYGTVDRALTHACQGGLRLGGGAAPIVDVFFSDDAS